MTPRLGRPRLGLVAMLVAVLHLACSGPSAEAPLGRSTLPPTHSFIFVHGVAGSWKEPGFDLLLSKLIQIIGNKDRVRNFQYFEDKGDAQPLSDSCGSEARRTFTPPPSTGGMPLPSAVQPGRCYSQSDVGINAVLLDEAIAKLHRDWHGNVTIIANSMGAAIVRAYLGYAVATRTGTEQFVDTVVMLHGAEAGSYVTLAKPLLLSSGYREVYAVVGSAVDKLFNRDPNSPAFDDLTPRSELLEWVNPPMGHLPAHIRYLNVASDIKVKPLTSLWEIAIGNTEIPVGDYILMPGDSDPTLLPPLGGARFDPRKKIGRGTEDSDEWILPRTIPIEWALLVPFINSGDLKDVPDAVADALQVPEWHGGLGSHMDRIHVPDHRGSTARLDMLLAHLISRAVP